MTKFLKFIKYIIYMVNSMNLTKMWIKSLLESMGNAFLHPFSNNQPPYTGYQPYSDIPSKKHRII